VIAALALTAAGLLLAKPYAVDAQPEVILVFPEEGDIMAEPPPIIRMCFARPINIRDLDDGGDFRFRVTTPEGRGLGLRIVFQTDGLGVDIHRGIPEGETEGEWTFEWRVTEPDTLEPAQGTLRFLVGPGGSPVPEEPPANCPSGNLTPVTGITPTTVTASPTPPPDRDKAGDGQDDLLLALIIAGPVIGAAALGLGLYFLVFRRRGPAPPAAPPE